MSAQGNQDAAVVFVPLGDCKNSSVGEELEQRESRRYLQDWPEGTAGWRNVRARRSWGEKSVTAHRHFFNLQQRRSHCLKKI